MSESTIRTAIYDTVRVVSSVGKVYDYERWTVDWSDFLDLFKSTTGIILGWEVSYHGWEPPEPGAFGDLPEGFRSHLFMVQGYMGLDDSEESEKTFAALVETIANALDDDTTLHGSTYYHCSMAAAPIEHRVFGGVLCHYAAIGITVTEYVT